LNWLDLLAVAAGLAMDCFAVSVAAGLTVAPVTGRHTFRLAFHFGLFQFMMPVVGWLAGKEVAGYVGGHAHWVVFSLLGFVGGKMLWEARQQKDANSGADPTRGLMLVTLCLATSIDALAVGVSMAFLPGSIWASAVVIGIVAMVLSAAGIGFGGRLGPGWGRWADAAGGCMLLLIALKTLVEHLAG